MDRRMTALHYIYAVFRPDGRIMYIGKGTGQRWKRHDKRAAGNPHYAAILRLAGGDLPTCIIAAGLSEKKAFEYEEIYVKAIGLEKNGGPLVNAGHGGRGGPYGIIRSAEWRKTRALRAKEAWQNPEYRAKMLRPDRNRSGNKLPRSQEFKAALSERLKGNTQTLGFKHKDGSRAKMSAARKGFRKSALHRARIGAAHLGMKRSALAISNMKTAQERHFETVRANMLDLMSGVL